jgi:hypothetical protein
MPFAPPVTTATLPSSRPILTPLAPMCRHMFICPHDGAHEHPRAGRSDAAGERSRSPMNIREQVEAMPQASEAGRP